MSGVDFLRAFRRALALGVVAHVLAPAALSADPVLHEYVPNVNPTEATPAALGDTRVTGSAPASEGADVAGSDAPAAPAYEATQADGSTGDPPGRRSPSFRPDRLTELANGLDYYEVFRPSIAPFKRVTSLSRVHLDGDRTTPVLGMRDDPPTEVPVEGEDSPAPDARPRDRFSADVRLDFREGRVVPLPSVSPESRILSLRASPEVRLRIERDADDNFAARLLGPVPDVPVDVAFVTDAPRSYFGTDIPAAPVDALAAEVPRLPPSVRSRALAMARRMRVTPRSDLRTALERLTQYFRAFEESKTPPENTGDLYLDLVRSQKGICRHRAYGFVVTAQALGIPARFVQNEAHSWVEVKLPRAGYMRIDLGGAADGLTAHNAVDVPAYVPSQPDPLPQPASYRRAYAQAAERARGTAPDARGLAGRWLDSSSVQSNPSSSVSLARSPYGHDPAPLGSTPGSPDAFPGDLAARGAPGQSAGEDSSQPERAPVSIRLEERTPTALRGTPLSLSGRVANEADQGVAGMRVEVWIASRAREERMLLGVCVTDGQGRFEADVGLPPDLQVGDYRLIVMTPGDSRHSPAVAR